jgi:hypothetical protein
MALPLKPSDKYDISKLRAVIKYAIIHATDIPLAGICNRIVENRLEGKSKLIVAFVTLGDVGDRQ